MEHNSNWSYLTSDQIKVGDLVWWNFNSTWNTPDWKLCIITDVALEPAEQKSVNEWRNLIPNFWNNNLITCETGFVENTRRDKCKFNSFTFMCPQNSKKKTILVHPTYKQKWGTTDLSKHFMTQAHKEIRDARANHNALVNQKEKDLKTWWREVHSDIFDGKDYQDYKENNYHPNVYDWTRELFNNWKHNLYKDDETLFHNYIKSLDSKTCNPVMVVKDLNNLSPRLTIHKFLNGIEINDGKAQGNLEINYIWKVEKNREWFENKLNKSFDDCRKMIVDWCNANCSPAVAHDLLENNALQNYAFTPEWFERCVLSHSDRDKINNHPDEPIMVGATSYHPHSQTSSWTYEIE